MAQAPGQAIAAAQRGFSRLSNPQKLAFLAAAAFAAAALAVALLWARGSEYRVLYSNLADRDGGEVIAALAQLNVAYRVAEGGSVVLVPAESVYDLRLKLASQGLPKGGAVGFELMDNQKFGISQFAEQVNYQRALAGELARSIQAVAAIQSARVHLAIPRQSVFIGEQKAPSASVFLTTRPGRTLDGAQVTAIQHMVASSVPDLGARSVTVVDQSGNLLSGADLGSPVGTLDAVQLRYLHAVETAYAERVENILAPLVGRENVRAQVTAALDFSQVEQTSETFTANPPGNAAIRSQQLVESAAADNAANPAPGSAGRPPAARPPRPSAASAAREATVAGSYRESVVNYELDKTVRHTRAEVGGIRRLSAAVVVNYRREVAADGRIVYAALAGEVLDKIAALTREAIGFSPSRGDTLNLVNAPFTSEPAPAPLAQRSPWAGLAAEVGSLSASSPLRYAALALAALTLLVAARERHAQAAPAPKRAGHRARNGGGEGAGFRRLSRASRCGPGGRSRGSAADGQAAAADGGRNPPALGGPR
jgi:flagellar M-ring protein FliF